MTISDIAKPVVEAILGKPEPAPKGSMEEAQQKIVELGFEIVELTRRPPSTSPEVERKRLDDLAIARRNLEAWEAVRDGLLQQKADKELAQLADASRLAVAAAKQWRTESADPLWAGWEAFEAGYTLGNAEFRATQLHNHRKSGGRDSLGQSTILDMLQKYREGCAEMLVELGIARKVHTSNYEWTLARIQAGK